MSARRLVSTALVALALSSSGAAAAQAGDGEDTRGAERVCAHCWVDGEGDHPGRGR